MSIDDSKTNQTESSYRKQSTSNNTIDEQSRLFQLINQLSETQLSETPLSRPPDLITHNNNGNNESQNSAPSSVKPVSSRIPRIPHLHTNKTQNLPDNSLTSTPIKESLSQNLFLNKSIDTTQTTATPTPITTTQKVSKMRAPRSLSKVKTPNSHQQITVDSVTKSMNAAATAAITTSSSSAPKRGVSLVNNSRKFSVANSMNNSRENLNDSFSSGSGVSQNGNGGKKNVKYLIRHKPKESNVKIESHKLEWKAQSKIGSLEKAATYKPAGGNVKIENHKVEWNAQSKIGSLEKAANYKPAGGNVKIQSFKLDFNKRAKPKTDTGLIVIELDGDEENEANRSQNLINNDSQNSSIDHLNRSQYSLVGSN
jgi:hypothetical protein